MIYIDTSVIISVLDPLDSEHSLAKRELSSINDKIISELTLVELSTVLQRRMELSSKTKESGPLNIIDTFSKILYIQQEMELRLVAPRNLLMGSPIGNLNLPYLKAIELSSNIPMRTLDLLHLAYATEIRKSVDIKLDFLTRDNEFARYSDLIRESCGLELIILGQ